MSRIPKLLVTGATGLLGNALIQASIERYTVTGLARHPEPASAPCEIHPVDLLDQEVLSRVIRTTEPDLVIHAAAMVDVDQCQRDPETAFAVNVEGTRNLLRSLGRSRCRFLFISTESVFDGEKGNYTEEDPTQPIHVYGKSKFEAERIILRSRPDALVTRVSFYGWNATPSKSPKKKNLAEWVLSHLKERQEIPGFTDLHFSPIPAPLLAEALLELAEKDCAGILHVAGSQGCSKYEFARELAIAFGFSPSLVIPTISDSGSLTAPRPKNVTLCVEKASQLLGRSLPNLLEGLQAFRSCEPMLARGPS